MKNYLSLIFFVTLNLNAQTTISELLTNPNDSTFVRIFYNEVPDSLKMNGKLIFIDNGKMMKIKPGIYTFEALKNCYYPTKKKVSLVPNKIKPISLKMIHLSSPEKSAYDISLYSNIVALPILNTIMIANNKDFVLPIVATSLVQTYWHWQQKNNFDPCTQKYIAGTKNKNDLDINFGVSFQTADYPEPISRPASYLRKGANYHFTQRFNQELNLSLKAPSFIPNLALFFELRKYFITSKVFAELSVLSFLNSKIKFEIMETDLYDVVTRDYAEEFTRKHPFIIEVSANIEFLSVLNQTWIFSLGGYWGNPLIPKNDFLAQVQQPYLPHQIYETPDVIKISQKSYGIKVGIFSEIPIGRNIIYGVGFKWYSESTWGFTMLTSGFKYNLW